MNLINMDSHRHHFAGVAVGGPRNGQQLVWESPSLTVMIKPPEAPFIPRGQGIPANAKVESFDYIWVEGHRDENNPLVNFWVPRDKTLAWALTQLAQAHVDAHAAPIFHGPPIPPQLNSALGVVAVMGRIEPGETCCATFALSPEGRITGVFIQNKGG